MIESQIELKIKGELENISLVGTSINNICLYIGFNEDESYNIELAIVELLNNIIEHSYLDESEKEIIVKLDKHNDKLVIKITDFGSPFDIRNVNNGLDFDPEDILNLPEGGMGLFLIKQIMDEISYEENTSSNETILVKNIKQ